MEKEQLITLVIRQIQKDLDVGDTSAIEEMLDALPERTLEGFLSEAE
jgi:hypothetical protein